MSYISFDKVQMTNLQESMTREILCNNKFGAYCCTTAVGCNIRKYHGLFVVPIPELDDENHVLLSSLDETIIQHEAEFHLAVHKYQGDNYSPKGHKYIRFFEWDKSPKIIYRVGGVILEKEIHFLKDESRLIIKYTLTDAHSKTTLRLRPFLAFRSVREFTRKNDNYNGSYLEIDHGIKACMYKGYPELFMQISKKNVFEHRPDWYMGFDYPKERERGYSSIEDLFSPGYFDVDLKKGESIYFTAALKQVGVSQLKRMVDKDDELAVSITGVYGSLCKAARQFNLSDGKNHYIIAGYPWFKCRGRDLFVSMPGLTLTVGRQEHFEKYMDTAKKALYEYMAGNDRTVKVYEMGWPDVPLWAVWCLQQYFKHVGYEAGYAKYGNLLEDLMTYIIKGKHDNLFVHENGLIYANGKGRCVTWMNSNINGIPVVERSGYIVEFNALWYNALCFSAKVFEDVGRKHIASICQKIADKIPESFQSVFLNEYGYLYDWVDGENLSWEVRPNMIFAIALDYSPLNREQRKKVLDICTKELLTPKGLRSLSPKSGCYNPIYKGSPTERDQAYHQGTAWPWLTGFYLEAYLKVYKMSGLSFIERQLIGFEEELFYHCIGSIPELFDGNPPFHGRGAICYAMNVAEMLRTIRMLDKGQQTI